VLLLILKIARMYSADYGGWARPSTADLSIILGPVVPFRRTRRALFDGVPCTAREIYEGKHSRRSGVACHSSEINMSRSDNIMPLISTLALTSRR